MKYLIAFLITTISIAGVPQNAFYKPKNEIWVMVIDGGVGRNAMLLPQTQYNNTDDYKDEKGGHGTHVAGIVLYGNQGLSGYTCPNVKLFSCKALHKKNYDTTTECVTRAIYMGIDFINYSASGDAYDEKERQAFKLFGEKGGVAVVAAGNESRDISFIPAYPASYNDVPNMIIVQNRGKNGKLHRSSNWHPLAVTADGEDIMSTLPNNNLGTMTGTSMAAPAITHYLLKKKCATLLQ